MNDRIRSSEMTILLACILTAQWFSSTSDGFLDACGNAVVLPMIAGGLALTLLTLLLHALTPKQGLLRVCSERKGLMPFPLILALLFTLLSATALRDTLTMLSLFLLPRSPRWFSLLLLLPVIILTGALGIASVSRALKLVAPLLFALFAVVLLLSVWNQANPYNFFPILGNGWSSLGKTAFSSLSVVAWLPMLWIDKPQLKSSKRVGLKACLWATGLCATGYIFYALLFPNGVTLNTTFPLHRLSASGGFSNSFQRTHALFVFVWLPVQLAAVSTGLCYAVRSLHAVWKVRNPRALLPLPIIVITALALQDIEHSPQFVNILLQTNMQALLLIPLFIPMIAGKIIDRRQDKEAQHA